MKKRIKIPIFFLSMGIILFYFMISQAIAADITTTTTTDINTTEYNDPALFKIIIENKREIYILGSPHLVPLEMLLSPRAIQELESIAEQKAILYTEHEISNVLPLEYFNNGENSETSPVPYQELVNSLEDFNKIKSLSIYLRLSDEGAPIESAVTIEQLLHCHLWLMANILGTHSGILSYHNFKGADYSLLYNPIWKEKWGETHFLETPKEVIKILKKHSKGTQNSSLDSIKKSLATILTFASIMEFQHEVEVKAIFEENIKEELKGMSKRYSWKSIEFSNRRMLPESAIERSALWANVIAEKLNTNQQDLRPILIVVGNAHLAGFHESFSFLSFLLGKIKATSLQRLTNDGKWINIKH